MSDRDGFRERPAGASASERADDSVRRPEPPAEPDPFVAFAEWAGP